MVATTAIMQKTTAMITAIMQRITAMIMAMTMVMITAIMQRITAMTMATTMVMITAITRMVMEVLMPDMPATAMDRAHLSGVPISRAFYKPAINPMIASPCPCLGGPTTSQEIKGKTVLV